MRRLMTDTALREGYEDAIRNGTLIHVNGSRKLTCTVCGRNGYYGGSWYERCSLGHPYKCDCGRSFSTGQGFAHHTRGFRWGNACPVWKERNAQKAQA